MEINIKYGIETQVNDKELQEIRNIAKKYGEVKEDCWGIRYGAINIVSDFEFSVGFLGTYFAGKVLDKIGKELLKNKKVIEFKKYIEKKVKTFDQIDKFKSFLAELYEQIFSKNKEAGKAFTLIEDFNDFSLYIVINHNQMNKELINKLPEAILLSYTVLEDPNFKKQQQKTLQLYPNFQKNTWDYILIPELGFDNITKYFDLNKYKLCELLSYDEYINKFNPNNINHYKLLTR